MMRAKNVRIFKTKVLHADNERVIIKTQERVF